MVLVAEADIRALSFREKGGRHTDLLESFYVVTSRETARTRATRASST